MTIIKIQNKEISPIRLRLKAWSKLEGLKQEIDTATSKNDFNLIFNSMVKFIEVAVSPSPSKIEWDKVPWYEFLEIYFKVVEINSPTIEFPILRGSGGDTKKQPWEYEGRSWYFWFNLFSKNYGWSEETISNLDIDDALGLYQELQIDDQMGKEWQWGLSEVAFKYEKSTNKSIFQPLPRPNWMKPIIPKQLPVVRMLKSHLPMGNVVDLQELEAERQKKNGSKDT